MTQNFSYIYLPDTQFYSSTYPSNFTAQTQWIVDNKDALNIQFVLHVGDVVNTASSTTQWTRADAAFDILDADDSIPYLVCIGNHDYNSLSTRSVTNFKTYFPQSRYTSRSWWNGGFYSLNNPQNLYQLHDYEDAKFLLLSLEFGPRQEVLDWAMGLMSTYSDRKVILTTHSFMYRDGTRCTTGDQYNPHNYGMGADVHDGEEMWQEIKSAPNLIWVQNGHDILGANVSVSVRRTDAGTNGNDIKQVQANYQQFTNGGNGYLRIMNVKPALGTVEVQTYSPVLDAFITNDKEQFTYPFMDAEPHPQVPGERFGPATQTLF